jgi:serine/threonine protein phosphatase PrpC
VNCPHCGAVCQVQEQFLGGNLTCGKCARVFATRRPETATVPPAASAPTPPGEPETADKQAKPRSGGLWSGMQNLYQKISKPISSAIARKNEPSPEGEAAGDDELGLVLDGPTVEALKQQEEAEKSRPPRLGSEPAALHGAFRLSVAGATSMGMVRDRNEDSFLLLQQSWSNLDARHEAALVVVADGMGGYEAGDRASYLSIEYINAALSHVWSRFAPTVSQDRQASFREPIEAAIKAANAVVHQQGQQSAHKGMGATAAVVLIWDGQVEIGHVGDCRVYLFHDGNLTQVTRDQTLVARMVELGQLSPAEAKNHPKANEVTQAIGRNPDIQPAFYATRMAPGDWLLVACDGLHAHVDVPALAETLQAASLAPALVAHYLVDLVNYRGGTDNCTVVAVRCY